MDVSSIHSTTFSNFRLELINIRWRLSSSSHLWFLLCAFPFSIFLKHFSPSFHAIELEFLRKRQVAWEESFRDLYYMLRKNICGLFYHDIFMQKQIELHLTSRHRKIQNRKCNIKKHRINIFI